MTAIWAPVSFIINTSNVSPRKKNADCFSLKSTRRKIIPRSKSRRKHQLFPRGWQIKNVSRRSIVAVHGLGGDWESTWTDSGDKLWLRDFLPKQLKEAGVESRIFSYGYDASTAFSNSVADIDDQACILLDFLKLERSSSREEQRPIIFIAHSLGGIIVKKVS